MATVSGYIQKDTFTYTTAALYQEILFAFTNVNPPCVIKDITITLAPPTPGAPVSISVEMTKAGQNYYVINKVDYTGNTINSTNVPIWFDENMTSGSFKIDAPIGTVFSVAFSAVAVPSTSSYNTLISGEIDSSVSFSTPVTLYTNATSGLEHIKGISLALPLPASVNLSLFYSDQSSTVPFATASFVAGASNSTFLSPSPTFAYLLSNGASILMTGDVNGITVDYYIHYTV